jgi:hypothetical protein
VVTVYWMMEKGIIRFARINTRFFEVNFLSFSEISNGGIMNRFLKAAVGILFSASLLGLSAQQSGGMGQGGMGGMMGGTDSSSMHGMMMHMMKPSYVFNTSDGGFVVFMGNKILKYDKDLNLKKEVQMKVDTTGMGEMMKQCPRRQGSGSDTTGHGSHH